MLGNEKMLSSIAWLLADVAINLLVLRSNELRYTAFIKQVASIKRRGIEGVAKYEIFLSFNVVPNLKDWAARLSCSVVYLMLICVWYWNLILSSHEKKAFKNARINLFSPYIGQY